MIKTNLFRSKTKNKKTLTITVSMVLLLSSFFAIANAETYSLILTWGDYGIENGQFNHPTGIEFDNDGNVYVADHFNHRVQKFTSDGIFITKWGGFGGGNGQFQFPTDITVDDFGNVYVTDQYNHRVQKFTSDGIFITKWGSLGSADGQFNYPRGIDVDDFGNVYVADTWNGRVQKFTSDGIFITKWDSWNSGIDEFISPYNAAVDDHRNVFVVDYEKNCIHKFAPTDSISPTIELISPTEYGLYAADSGATYEFSATDNIDLDVDLTATIDDIQGNAIEVQNGDSIPTESGVYDLTLTATDDAGLSSSLETMFVVYDAGAGFVTGGGWINSPEGAYIADSTLTGKATFGLVSKYKKGANTPTGQTQFKFNVADLNFHSTSYDWLVIAGSKAQYKGTGTINGEGEYGFKLTATDGDIKGDGIDNFRIKIWDKTTDSIVYDNQIEAPDTADPTTAIGGGSIVIHK